MSREESLTHRIGTIVFVALCGVPALEMNGFGFGLPITLPIAIACSAAGGIVGGALVCPRPIIAGIVGGLIAGVLGMVAVAYYTSFRQQVATIELVLVQGIASLPGVLIGNLIAKYLDE